MFRAAKNLPLNERKLLTVNNFSGFCNNGFVFSFFFKINKKMLRYNKKDVYLCGEFLNEFVRGNSRVQIPDRSRT